jgi:predicted dinucleotide-binding enzyme
MMGARTPASERAATWARANPARASAGTFTDAATFGELVWNCTAGASSLEALAAAGSSHLGGKLLIDVANPLDFSRGMPPTLTVGNTDSLGERIQHAFPDCRVVKAFNTVNAHVIVEPGRVGHEHDLLICGNDAGAKARVREIAIGWFGWKSVIDLGDIQAARATEAYVTLWVRLWGAFGTADFGAKFVR